ncbi:hypothetical protein KEM60_00751 [Austwickia sp. TVS 96-490-7B]|uniref:polysaccharide pyruvyl transferase family protein n=1 Tax=Austwickia sp. TVS 96-490-7B TaxID=2830843 RepID=UPI001C561C21|nr:polysaccharide pyruvyl transferase family protein [Austwickia sp. TVS 96-490-7B]MBW3084563.1 hypothetical protein [Austwickia sp. TVS 96-490-7B]
MAFPALAGRFGVEGRTRVAARRSAQAAADLACPMLYPRAPVIPTYWWEGHTNFGDQLTPVLLRGLGVIATHRPVEQASVIGVGSLIQQLPSDFEGLLWGTGLIVDIPVDLPGVRGVGVRGELTRSRISCPGMPVSGDPGLLTRLLFRPVRRRYDVGVVVHYTHAEDARLAEMLQHTPGSLRIDVTRRPWSVARDIASCRRIVTTSLHGLILADAFGIPAVWIRMPQGLYGGDFKFRDHETVARPSQERGHDLDQVESLAHAQALAVTADEKAVDEACERIRRSVETLVDAAATPPSSPWRFPAWRT